MYQRGFGNVATLEISASPHPTCMLVLAPRQWLSWYDIHIVIIIAVMLEKLGIPHARTCIIRS